jgi:hypothetical protein
LIASEPKVCAGLEAQHAQVGALQRRHVAAARRRRVDVAALGAGEDEVRRLRLALAPGELRQGLVDLLDHRNRARAAALRARQLALAAGLDRAERLLVEGGRAPAQREQLAAAQAGERGGDVERPVLLRARGVGELDDLFGREEAPAPVVVDGLELLDSGGWLVD